MLFKVYVISMNSFYFYRISGVKVSVLASSVVENEELTLFLAHLAKGNVNFCHHLVSVNFSHFNILL
jgi:hypothetical protein